MSTNPDSRPRSTRREFVGLIATATAAVPLAGLAPAATAAPAPAQGGPGVMHVFSKPLQWLDYAGAAALIAEAGYGGIDYTVRPGGHVLPEKVQDDLPRAVEAARKAGLKVEMITTAVTTAKDKFTEPLLRTAAKLGVKYYRLGNFQYNLKVGIWESLQNLKPQLRELAALNQSLGLHGCIQNHAGPRVGGPVWDLYELVRDLDPRWFGVQYDIRHAVVEGAQSWPLALRLLAPWIRCTDLKDFKWEQAAGKATLDNVPIGQGVVGYDAYFKLVAELGLHGPRSVHFEYPPFERATTPLPEAEKRSVLLKLMKQDLAALRGYMAKYRIG